MLIGNNLQLSVYNVRDFVFQVLSEVYGKNSNTILIEKQGESHTTADGITVLKNLFLPDAYAKAILKKFVSASLKTDLICGDATTTTGILLCSMFGVSDLQRFNDNSVEKITVADELKMLSLEEVEYLISMFKELKGKKASREDVKNAVLTSVKQNETILDCIIEAHTFASGRNVEIVKTNKQNTTSEIYDGIYSKFFRVLDSKYYTDEASSVCSEKQANVIFVDKVLNYNAEISPKLKEGVNIVVSKDFKGDFDERATQNNKGDKKKIIPVKVHCEQRYDLLKKYVEKDRTDGLVSEFTANEFGCQFYNEDYILTCKYEDKVIENQDNLIVDKSIELKDNFDSVATGVIFVGGKNDQEAREFYDRVVDGVNTCFNADRCGVVNGGGLFLKGLIDKKQSEAVKRVLSICNVLNGSVENTKAKDSLLATKIAMLSALETYLEILRTKVIVCE